MILDLHQRITTIIITTQHPRPRHTGTLQMEDPWGKARLLQRSSIQIPKCPFRIWIKGLNKSWNVSPKCKQKSWKDYRHLHSILSILIPFHCFKTKRLFLSIDLDLSPLPLPLPLSAVLPLFLCWMITLPRLRAPVAAHLPLYLTSTFLINQHQYSSSSTHQKRRHP